MSDCFDHYVDAMEDLISGRAYDEGPSYYRSRLALWECSKCGWKFGTRYPKACPSCGGWSNIIKKDALK